MTLPIDLKLEKTELNTFDISWSDDGDFDMTCDYGTAVLCSLIGERRAKSYEIALPQYQRGWIGNILHQEKGDEDGCGNWLYEQARLNQTTINGIRDESEKGLLWMVSDELAEQVTVKSTHSMGKILTNVSLTVNDIEIFNTQVVCKGE